MHEGKPNAAGLGDVTSLVLDFAEHTVYDISGAVGLKIRQLAMAL
jgi:hypothetical protein